MKLQIGIDGKRYEVEVEVAEDDTTPHPAYVPPPTTSVAAHSAPIASVLRSGVLASQEVVADEKKVCRSPIAGMVIRVNVKPGQQIQPDDLLVVLEAMKMETNVTAPVAGKVKRIAASSGDAVQLNQVLIEFE